jgi:sugar lactone lactonase YvrE
MIRTAVAALTALALSTSATMAAEITILDGKTQPESLAVTPDGTLIAPSFVAPVIHIVRKGATAAETFVDLTAEGPGGFLGVLADGPSNTLWACHLTTGPAGRKTDLRAFDLTTKAQKLKWDLPGDTNTCNDVTVGPDKALYIADTSGKIYRLASGATTGELVSNDPAVAGIDGITFLNGALFYNSIFSGKLYRLPLDAAGKASTPVEIALDAPLTRPDGMRAANGKLFVGEGGGGRVLALTVSGNTAKVAVVKEGLQRPTGVEPAGGELWYNELTPGKLSSVPMPK